MLKCATSLWSADLANLAADIQRVEPYSERFHLDVADGHYSPTMLFFPDLVAALRPHTDRPFEMHLMTTDPAAWIDPFAEAGADAIISALTRPLTRVPCWRRLRQEDFRPGSRSCWKRISIYSIPIGRY